MEKRVNKKQIIPGAVLLLVLSVVCIMVYKAQIRDNLYQPIEYTMMTEHKVTGERMLSRDIPEMSEVFLCKVPELKKLSFECWGEGVTDEARVEMTLSDAESGKFYYHAEKSVRKLLPSEAKKRIRMTLPEKVSDSEDRELLLTWKLKNAGTTMIHLTANAKKGIVRSFNGVEGDRVNVIYTLHYSDNSCLKILYAFLCAALLLFAALSYWMLMIRQMGVEQFFVPMALFLGLIFQCLITVYGVPDEPGHLDTAYKYSNKMLFVKDTEEPDTLYKRTCDVEMSDMLANGLESNSYYQLMTHTFERAENTELMEVLYNDSTNLAPGIVYLPAALGISSGRLLGLSAMLTMQLGRIFNLTAFVLLVWAAIRLIPFGKNLLGMVAMLPIALQQGASASYDAMMNGFLLLFLALCFRMQQQKQRKKWELALLAFLTVLLAVVKGGVYLPTLLLLVTVFPWKQKKASKKRKKLVLLAVFLLAAAVVLLTIAAIKIMPILQEFLQEENIQGGGETLYTVPYLIQRPVKVIYLYWNTVVRRGDFLLRGFLGGILSWLDMEMSWIFVIIFLIGLLLLVNVEGDRYHGKKKEKLLIAAVCVISAALIMTSMLMGYTKRSAHSIQGLQGRYFLPLAPALFLLTSNQMVFVQKKQCRGIWMTMMVTEILLVLQAAAMVV